MSVPAVVILSQIFTNNNDKTTSKAKRVKMKYAYNNKKI